MSLLKKIGTFILLFSVLSFNANARATLYGFDSANPYTSAEKILPMKVAPRQILNYREAMRQNINMLSGYGKEHKPGFIVIVHEAETLLDKSAWEYQLDDYLKVRKQKTGVDDKTFLDFSKKLGPDKVGPGYYIKNIDAITLNNLLCSKNRIGKTALDNLFVLSIDQCLNDAELGRAIRSSVEKKLPFYGFIYRNNAFNKIKKQLIVKENTNNILKVSDALNFHVFIDDSLYNNKGQFVDDITNSNYDVIVINPLFHNNDPFTKDEVDSMKLKKMGPKRLIIALQNISEAKPTDYFWQKDWKIGSPAFLRRASFVDKDAVIAEYWSDDWKKIIGNYFKSIIKAGYDGAFLTGIQNYQYFETQTPLD